VRRARGKSFECRKKFTFRETSEFGRREQRNKYNMLAPICDICSLCSPRAEKIYLSQKGAFLKMDVPTSRIVSFFGCKKVLYYSFPGKKRRVCIFCVRCRSLCKHLTEIIMSNYAALLLGYFACSIARTHKFGFPP